jgi:hypothetical protein
MEKRCVILAILDSERRRKKKRRKKGLYDDIQARFAIIIYLSVVNPSVVSVGNISSQMM